MLKKFGIFLAVIVFVGMPLYSQRDAVARDILKNPEDWVNKIVIIRGEVIDVQAPSSVAERGYYVLMDSSDKKIKIVSETLPAPGQEMMVIGIVTLDPVDQVPFVRESSASPSPSSPPGETATGDGNSSNILIYILVVIIVVIVFAILYIAFLKPRVETRQAGIARPENRQNLPDAPAVEEKGTQQVSMTEVERAVGGLQTKQVPSLLAELKVLSGAKVGKSFPLGFNSVLGRVRGDIILEDASVSKEHAKITFLGDKYALENLSKTNPVILNGDKVQAQKELKDDDEIICGLIKLKFKLI